MAVAALASAFPALGVHHLAEYAGANVVAGFFVVIAAARLNADLDDLVVLLGGLSHRLAFAHVVRGRFFDVDVLAGLAGEDRRDGMPVCRCAHDDGVDRFVIEQTAEIGFDGRTLALEFLNTLGTLVEQSGIDIANGGDLDLGQFGESIEQAAATSANAHAGHPETFVRGDGFGARSGNGQAGAG